jgi:hypothetical protein
MEITVRNKQYKAEHLTDLNYLALGNLFIDDSGNFSLTNVEDYESLSQADKLRLTKPIMKRLIDPKEKAAIASSLSAIFPSLPRELVSYSSGEFTLNITIEELLRLSLAVANAIGNNTTKQKPQEITPVQEAAIVRLWTNIEEIQKSVDSIAFDDSIINIDVLENYRTRIESIFHESVSFAAAWAGSVAATKLPSRKDVLPILTSIQGRKEYKQWQVGKTTSSQEELAQAANIARLEEELKFAKSGRVLGK